MHDLHSPRHRRELSIINGAMPSPAKSAPLRHLAADSTDIPENGRLVVDVGDTTIGIFRVGGRLLAYENSCPHMGGPVCQGLVIPAVREVLDEQQVSTRLRVRRVGDAHRLPMARLRVRDRNGIASGKPSIRLTPVPVDEEDGRVYVVV